MRYVLLARVCAPIFTW